MKKRNPVTIVLHGQRCTLSTVRYKFDEVVNELPCTARRLNSTAPNIRDQNVDNGIVKTQQGNSGLLTENEAFSVRAFQNPPHSFNPTARWHLFGFTCLQKTKFAINAALGRI